MLGCRTSIIRSASDWPEANLAKSTLKRGGRVVCMYDLNLPARALFSNFRNKKVGLNASLQYERMISLTLSDVCYDIQ